MRFKNPKPVSLEFCFCLIVAIILLWPFFIKAQTIVLNEPGTSCIGSSGQVNLTWSSDVTNPSYYILRRADGEATSTIAGPISDTFFTDNNIVSDKAYFYKIRAEKGNNVYFSNEVQVSVLYCPAVLLAPASSCQADGPHISLNWSSVSGNLSRYEVYRDGVQISQTSNTNFNDGSNLEGTKTYNYFIKVVWQDGYATSSDVAPASALACPPTLTVISNCATEAPGGPRNNLSWNSLLGVQNYQIYRKAQSEADFSLLKTTTETSYTDNLVESLPTYAQAGQVSYYAKAIWLTDQKDSSIQSTNITRCSPYLKVESVCNSSGLLNPEMHLSWTATQGATLYNIYRNGSFYVQITNPGINDFIDYLDPATNCLNKICTHSYRVEAIVTGFPAFSSNQETKDIDCATLIAPSPAPVLNAPSVYCVSGDSRISVSWTSSDNIVYYTLYRNEVGIINLLETSFVDSGVEIGRSYTYRVTAFGKGGTFTDSQPPPKAITAIGCTPPSASTLSLDRGCEIGKPYVSLSWTQTSNTESYEIWRGPSSSNLLLLITFNKTSPEFTSRTWKDTNVSLSTAYYYKIVSKGPTGVPSSQSNVPSITTYSCLPTTPIVTVTPACSGNNSVINLSWVTDAANTTRYEIFRQDWSLTDPIKRIYTASTTNWQDVSVLPQTSYTYKVEAVGYLDSQRSTQGWKSAVTTYNCSAPGPFTLSEPNAYCQGPYVKSELSWSNSANATSYDLLRNRYSNGSIGQTDTLSNVASPFTDRGFANALNFDGNDFVNLGNPSIPLTGNLTIEFWAKPANITYGRQNPLCKYYANEFCLTMETNGSLSYYHGNNSSYMSFGTASVFTNNVWVHVVLTRDLSTRTMRSYKNGVFITSTTWSNVYDPVATANYTLRIGRGYVDDFRGIIDDVRLYSRVLSASEIQEHYQVIYNNESNLIGLWRFDERSGQTVSDSSNYVNNGTLGSTSSVGTDDPAWIQNGPQSQIKYSWQAKAIGPSGTTYSNITNPAIMPLCQPTKPGLVLNSFCNAGNNLPNVTLKWSYTTATVKYEIYRNGILIKTINQGDSEFTLRSWTDTNNGAGLTQNTSYNYYIKAIGPTGLTNQSDSISVTTPSCAGPSQPQDLTASFACGGTDTSYPQVNLGWRASAGATSYSIYKKVRSGSYSFLISTTLTSYTDAFSSVNVNTSYSYYVVAYGPGGASPPSTEVNITTNYCLPSTPSISSILPACESNSPVNTISWSEDTDFNVFNYEIYRNTINNIPATPIKNIASTSPEFASRTWKDNSGLIPSTEYYYWVRGVGPAGQRTSSSRIITTYGCGIIPAAPVLNLNNLFCQDNIPYATFSWNNVPNAYSYNLYRTNPDLSQSVYSTRISPFTERGSSALNFDGGNDYVINSSPSWDFTGNPTKSFSVSAWFKPNTCNDLSGISLEYYGYHLRLFARPNYWGFQMIAGSTSSRGGRCNIGQWQYVAGVYNATETKLYLYYNGNLVDSDVVATADTSDLNDGLRIGFAQSYFNGLIDEARIYNRALSPSEIANQYNGIYNNQMGLVGVWHFDEGTGNTAYDQSGNNNSGTLNNGPTWQADSPTALKVLPLGQSKNYKYKVKAFGIDAESNFSNEISFTAPSCSPAKPDLTVTAQCPEGNTQLFLDWSEDPNTSYWSIYKKRAEEPYSFLTNISPPQTDFTDDNVESGIVYEYYLTAVGKGVNTTSDAVSQTVSFCYSQPSKPVISVTPTCYGYTSRIKINWQSDPTGNTISYNIWRKNITLLETDFTKIFSDLPGTATQYLDTVVEANNYIYKVEAVGPGTENTVFSDPSNEVTSYECSKIPPFPPNLYLNLVYSVDHHVAVSIGWSDSSNEENYKVFRRLAGESEFVNSGQNWWKKIINILFDKVSAAYENPLVTLDADILNYVDYTVTDGQTYEYQVVASNINGETFSNILQVAVPIARPGEFDLSALRLPDGRIYLTWTEALTSEAGGGVTYDVLRSNTLTFDSFLVICPGVIDPRECYDNNPPLLSTVYYKAIATNIGGITESDIEKVGLPAPIWKEIMPW